MKQTALSGPCHCPNSDCQKWRSTYSCKWMMSINHAPLVYLSRNISWPISFHVSWVCLFWNRFCSLPIFKMDISESFISRPYQCWPDEVYWWLLFLLFLFSHPYHMTSIFLLPRWLINTQDHDHILGRQKEKGNWIMNIYLSNTLQLFSERICYIY